MPPCGTMGIVDSSLRDRAVSGGNTARLARSKRSNCDNVSMSQRMLLGAGILASSFVLTACGSGTQPSSTTTVPSTSSAPSSTGVATTGACSSSELSVSASQGSGAGGHEAVVVVFTNVSSTPCTLDGYPKTAWFVSTNGTRLEATVTQQVGTGVPIVTVTLAPGQKAATTVWTDNPQVPVPSCGPVATSAVAVELSADTSPITAAIAISVCSYDNIGTTPITAGTAETIF